MTDTTQTIETTAAGVSVLELQRRVEGQLGHRREHYRKLWAYYANPARPCAVDESESGSERPYRQAQEWGLPSRITGVRRGTGLEGARPVPQVGRKEIVIENDIGWRIDTMGDYLFGKPLIIESAAPEESRRKVISELLRLIFAHNGGIQFLQQIGLLGSVYGFVDVLVKLEETHQSGTAVQDLAQAPVQGEGAPADDSSITNTGASDNSLQANDLARLVRMEVVEPARALPFLSPRDWRDVDAYVQCWEEKRSNGTEDAPARRSWMQRMLSMGSLRRRESEASTVVVEVITPTRWQRFENHELMSQGVNALGQVPLVHIQNTPIPFQYEGAGDVEPLIPLQDELNERLSDRAHRITMQSFKMYLGKGIENFTSLPVAPGRMWMTDNDRAAVKEFGGDANCPSEESHIADVREALDKISGVSPIAAGVIKGRIGRLTSAAALRVTMMSLLARTEKKRTTYGAAIARMCELALAWLDAAGVFHTTPDERRVELHWDSPIPENDMDKLQEAEAKLRVGVARDVVLRELGY